MKNILITTIAAMLLVGCGEPSGIHKAAGAGNIEAVKQYLAAGKDVNAKNDHGVTPLHVVGMSGNKEITEVLIADGPGETPIHSGLLHLMAGA